MKLQTLLITTFALTLSFVNAEETTPVPPPQALLVPATPANGKDPYKDSTRVTPPPQFIVTEEMDDPVFKDQAGGAAPQVRPLPFEPQSSATETLSFCYEEFSLPLEVMVSLQHQQVSDVALYEFVRKNHESDREKAEIHREIFAVLKAKSGFPTSVKNNAVVVSPDSKTSSQVGYQLEVFYDGLKEIRLRFSLMNTSLTGYTKEMREGKEVDKPLINEERIDTTVTLSPGISCLVGTMNRTSSNVSTGSRPLVILGFITASPVE